MKNILAILFLLVSSPGILATPQAGARMATDGQHLAVHGFRVGTEIKSRIRAIESKRDYWISRSDNYEGFHAELKLEEKKLYLSKLWIDASKEEFKNGLQPVPLTDKGTFNPIFADWFTGQLIHYSGEQLGYTHLGTRRTTYSFEKGLLKKIERGPTDDQLKEDNEAEPVSGSEKALPIEEIELKFEDE